MILKAVSSFPPFCLLSSRRSGDFQSPFSSYQSAVIAFLFFYNRNLHADILLRSIATHSFSVLNLLYHVKAFLHLAKHGILVVEEWGAAHLGISLLLLLGKLRVALLLA